MLLLNKWQSWVQLISMQCEWVGGKRRWWAWTCKWKWEGDENDCGRNSICLPEYVCASVRMRVWVATLPPCEFLSQSPSLTLACRVHFPLPWLNSWFMHFLALFVARGACKIDFLARRGNKRRPPNVPNGESQREYYQHLHPLLLTSPTLSQLPFLASVCVSVSGLQFSNKEKPDNARLNMFVGIAKRPIEWGKTGTHTHTH